MEISGLGNAFGFAREGMDKATREVSRVAQDVAEKGVEGLDRNLVSLTVSKSAFEANAAVVRVADEMTKDLLDILA